MRVKNWKAKNVILKVFQRQNKAEIYGKSLSNINLHVGKNCDRSVGRRGGGVENI